MNMDSVLYQLMDIRTNGILDKIIEMDKDYQEINRKSDIYSKQLDDMNLTKEIRALIDGYVSEQNALGARYGALAYLLGFSDCVELMTKPFHLKTVQKTTN
ncbi:MAG: hypothetical protein K2K21_06015 [Lachnospiraceae bacterium]|nr:hypothetical protein [Lachnospiraceae bacterium]